MIASNPSMLARRVVPPDWCKWVILTQAIARPARQILAFVPRLSTMLNVAALYFLSKLLRTKMLLSESTA